MNVCETQGYATAPTRIALRLLLFVFSFGLSLRAAADENVHAEARYIANMGVMISRGDTRVLFDPLFSRHFDTYHAVPAAVEAAILAGEAPWDGIDAVFISHYHGDHFDPATILRLLRGQPAIRLFAPEQAASAIRELVGDPQDPVLDRVQGFALENGESATAVDLGSLLVEAIRVPHGGWPRRHSQVENLVFRVTLDGATTVMHFGDADSADAHFAAAQAYWQRRRTQFAMPPYWFFLNAEGRKILEHRIGAQRAVGMHVPRDIPDSPGIRPAALRDVDLFTSPGEVRRIADSE